MKRTKQTATETYVDRRLQIEGLLNRIQVQLKIEDTMQQADPENWGYAGDLGHVVELLTNVADFLPVCMCKRHATCSACAEDKAHGKR